MDYEFIKTETEKKDCGCSIDWRIFRPRGDWPKHHWKEGTTKLCPTHEAERVTRLEKEKEREKKLHTFSSKNEENVFYNLIKMMDDLDIAWLPDGAEETIKEYAAIVTKICQPLI